MGDLEGCFRHAVAQGGLQETDQDLRQISIQTAGNLYPCQNLVLEGM